jgi:predicted O-methyltransferase YrrM
MPLLFSPPAFGYLRGTADHIVDAVADVYPEAAAALRRARELVPACKREIWPHQAAALYGLACAADRPGGHILEIGTALGYSAAIMALAAPCSQIATLNPKALEHEQASDNLASLVGVDVLCLRSDEYLAGYDGPELDLVFVDGDHSRDGVTADLAWWQWVRVGGLMLFHDVSPAGSKRANPDVYTVVHEFGQRLGRQPDVWIEDDGSVGMAGFYRREGE